MSSNQYWIIDTYYTLCDKLLIELLAKHINIVAITTVCRPNIHPEIIKNDIEEDLLKWNISNVPVYVGADRPFIDYAQELNDDVIHMPYVLDSDEYRNKSMTHDTKTKDSYSISNTNNIAALKIMELAQKYGKSLNILTLGPLTNLAIASLIDNQFCNSFSHLYITGGSIDNIGNSGNMAEFNFRFDPIAAQIAFRHFKNIKLIPLEIEKLHSQHIATHFDLFQSELGQQFKSKLSEVSEKNKDLHKYSNYTFSFLSFYAGLIVICPNLLKSSLNDPCDIEIIGKHIRGGMLIEKYPWMITKKKNIAMITTELDEKLLGEEIKRLFA